MKLSIILISALLVLPTLSETFEDQEITLESNTFTGNIYIDCNVTITSAQISETTFDGGVVVSTSENSQDMTFKNLDLTSTSASHQRCTIENITGNYSQLSISESTFNGSEIDIFQGQISQNSGIEDSEFLICEAGIDGGTFTGGSVHITKGTLSNIQFSNTLIILEDSTLSSSTVNGGTVCYMQGSSPSDTNVLTNGVQELDSTSETCQSITNPRCPVEEDEAEQIKVLVTFEIRYQIELSQFEEDDLDQTFKNLISGLFESADKVIVIISDLQEGSTIIIGHIETTNPNTEASNVLSALEQAEENGELKINDLDPDYFEYQEQSEGGSNYDGESSGTGFLAWALPILFILGFGILAMAVIVDKKFTQVPNSNSSPKKSPSKDKKKADNNNAQPELNLQKPVHHEHQQHEQNEHPLDKQVNIDNLEDNLGNPTQQKPAEQWAPKDQIGGGYAQKNQQYDDDYANDLKNQGGIEIDDGADDDYYPQAQPKNNNVDTIKEQMKRELERQRREEQEQEQQYQQGGSGGHQQYDYDDQEAQQQYNSGQGYNTQGGNQAYKSTMGYDTAGGNNNNNNNQGMNNNNNNDQELDKYDDGTDLNDVNIGLDVQSEDQ